MLNKIYIYNITTLFVLKCYIVAITFHDTSKVWWEHPYFVTNAISKTQLNMHFKTNKKS